MTEQVSIDSLSLILAHALRPARTGSIYQTEEFVDRIYRIYRMGGDLYVVVNEALAAPH